MRKTARNGSSSNYTSRGHVPADTPEFCYLQPRRHSLPLVTVDAVRALEQAEAARLPDYTLMSRAGKAAWIWANHLAGNDPRPWLLLAGSGNNGGDVFVVALHAHQAGRKVHVCTTGPTNPDATDALRARQELEDAGICVFPSDSLTDIRPDDWACIIDGLLGIGLRSQPAAETARLIGLVNDAAHPFTLAIDVPSGLNADTGHVPGACIAATHTLTMIACKPGLLTADGPDHTGSLLVADLGIAAPVSEMHAESDEAVFGLWPHRNLNSHKGVHGDVVVIGGDRGMTGAAILAGRSAVRLGAGRVFVGLLDGPHPPGYDPAQPELMLRAVDTLADQAGVWVIGPGAGQSDRMRSLLKQWIRHWQDAPAALPRTLVLDADALNLMAADPSLAVKIQALPLTRVLTPHPLEAARLLGKTSSAIQTDRCAAATALARQFDAIVVLKGMGTVIADPGRVCINLTGGPALASGGTGDVLAGAIGALLAQEQMSPGMPANTGNEAWNATQLATFLHGACCDALPGENSPPMLLNASDLPERMRDICHFRMNGA